MKATRNTRKALMESDRTLGRAADLLLGLHRVISGEEDPAIKRLQASSALEQLRSLVSSEVWSPSLGAVLAGRSEHLLDGPYAQDVLVQAVQEVTERRAALCVEIGTA